jgi:uncharacterized protein (TIGR02453 family)
MTVSTSPFAGFPREGLEFLAGLENDNSKEYFDAHRATYQSALLQPAKEFVVALGEELHARVSPSIRAEPRVNGSILRINRDTRFSADKRPYKGHLDFWFWEGEEPSRERPGLFVRLRAERVGLGAGMHHFTLPFLTAYRAAVGDERAGAALEVAIARATDLPGVQLGRLKYKRVPQGYPDDHPRAELLRHDALVVGGEWDMPPEVSGPGFVAWVAERLERMAPIERWLTEIIEVEW